MINDLSDLFRFISFPSTLRLVRPLSNSWQVFRDQHVCMWLTVLCKYWNVRLFTCTSLIKMVYVPWWHEWKTTFGTTHGKEGRGEGKKVVNHYSTDNLQIFSRPFSSLVTGHHQQPLIHNLLRSAKDLEVAGAGLVHCHFPLPPSFFMMCSSKRCPSCTPLWSCTACYVILSLHIPVYTVYICCIHGTW